MRVTSFAQPNGRIGISNCAGLIRSAADAVTAAVRRPKPKRKVNELPLDTLVAARDAAQAALDKYKADQEKAREPVEDAREADRATRHAERKLAQCRGNDDREVRLLQLALTDAEREAERLWRIAAPIVEAQRAAQEQAGGSIGPYDPKLLELEREVDSRAAAVSVAAEQIAFAERGLDAVVDTLTDAMAAVNAALLPALAARKAFASAAICQRLDAALADAQIASPKAEDVKALAEEMEDRAKELRQEPLSEFWRRVIAAREAGEFDE